MKYFPYMLRNYEDHFVDFGSESRNAVANLCMTDGRSSASSFKPHSSQYFHQVIMPSGLFFCSQSSLV